MKSGNYQRGKLRKGRLFLAFILCLAIISVVLVDILVRPMIQTYGSNQATTAATKAVNDAVERVLSEMNMSYADLATVQKDAEGKILSVETNTGNINLLKSAVSKAILEELDNEDMQLIKIPIGSLAGGLLTGRGPNLTIKIPMNSTVETSFNSIFESAGINQTRHDISLDVKVTIYAVIQGNNTAIIVETGFAIAENILVGEVPNWMVNRSS